MGSAAGCCPHGSTASQALTRAGGLLCSKKLFTLLGMAPHTPFWKWIFGLVVMIVGLAIAVPLGRYADRDDAPGGVVIAFLIFVGAAAVAMWIVNPRRESSNPGSN